MKNVSTLTDEELAQLKLEIKKWRMAVINNEMEKINSREFTNWCLKNSKYISGETERDLIKEVNDEYNLK